MWNFSGFILYIVMTVQIFIGMFPAMWLFTVSISIVVLCEQRQLELNTTDVESGYLWWPLCCRWRRLCLSFLEWQLHLRPAIVGGHGAYLFRIRNKWPYQWTTNDKVICRGIILQFPRYTFMLWYIARVHIYFFHLVNNKLGCGFHHCSVCFSFLCSHVSGQIWP